MSKTAHFNKIQLERLLTIEDPQKETVYGVIGRMEILLDFLENNPKLHGFIPFLKTYYFVTKGGAEKYLTFQKYFGSVREYETLDVYFASLYFKPLKDYLIHGECAKPWQHYFHYCFHEIHSIPFLQMLLGINAHINTDLYVTLIDLKYKNKKDFLMVNTILREVTPAVMKYLAWTSHDIFGLTGLALKDFVINQVHQVVERWRLEAWNNAQFTTAENKEVMLYKLQIETEQVAEKLITDFQTLYHQHFQNFGQLIKTLDHLSVIPQPAKDQ